jgi:hypothetical protein
MGRPNVVDREAILECSARLFARQGYHATSVLDVANARAVTRSSLYSCYPNKRAILAACRRSTPPSHGLPTPRQRKWALMYGDMTLGEEAAALCDRVGPHRARSADPRRA